MNLMKDRFKTYLELGTELLDGLWFIPVLFFIKLIKTIPEMKPPI